MKKADLVRHEAIMDSLDIVITGLGAAGWHAAEMCDETLSDLLAELRDIACETRDIVGDSI